MLDAVENPWIPLHFPVTRLFLGLTPTEGDVASDGEAVPAPSTEAPIDALAYGTQQPLEGAASEYLDPPRDSKPAQSARSRWERVKARRLIFENNHPSEGE